MEKYFDMQNNLKVHKKWIFIFEIWNIIHKKENILILKNEKLIKITYFSKKYFDFQKIKQQKIFKFTKKMKSGSKIF